MRTALWNYASRLTGIPADRIIWNNYNFDTPARPYATIQIISSQDNNPTYFPPDSAGYATMALDTTLTLQVQVYADATPLEAFEIVQAARRRAQLISEQQLLRADGLALVDTLSTQDAPSLIGTEWESRGIIDLQLRTLTTLADDVGLIERVETTGDVDRINVNVNTEV